MDRQFISGIYFAGKTSLHGERSWANLLNSADFVSRFILTIAFLVAIFVEFPYHATVSLLLFSAASLTDYFDGSIARRRKLITNFGIHTDPLADKILVCSAFLAFVGSVLGFRRGWRSSWWRANWRSRARGSLAASKSLVLAAERLWQGQDHLADRRYPRSRFVQNCCEETGAVGKFAFYAFTSLANLGWFGFEPFPSRSR